MDILKSTDSKTTKKYIVNIPEDGTSDDNKLKDSSTKTEKSSIAGSGSEDKTDVFAARKEYIEAFRNGVKSLLDPTGGMSEAKKARYYNRVMYKLRTGKKLTAEELRFIRVNYPEMYPQVVRVQLKRQSLEEQVKHCRSKEEVNDTCLRQTSLISDKDPMAQALYAACNDVEAEFKKTSQYKSLPDTNKEANEKKNNTKASLHSIKCGEDDKTKSLTESLSGTSTESYADSSTGSQAGTVTDKNQSEELIDNYFIDESSFSCVDFSG